MALRRDVVETTADAERVHVWDDATGWETWRWEPKPSSPDYDPAQANEWKIRDRAELAIDRMTQIATQGDALAQGTGNLTAAQLTTHLRTMAGAVADIARAERALIRLQLGRFEAAE